MSAGKEMAPHIRKTVAEIDGDIQQLTADVDRLRAMRTGLVELYGGDTEVPPTPPLARAKAKPAKKKMDEANGDGTGPAPAGVYIPAMRTLPEPFTAEALTLATQRPKKNCGIALAQMCAKGYLDRVGSGQYQRSKSFPAS